MLVQPRRGAPCCPGVLYSAAVVLAALRGSVGSSYNRRRIFAGLGMGGAAAGWSGEPAQPSTRRAPSQRARKNTASSAAPLPRPRMSFPARGASQAKLRTTPELHMHLLLREAERGQRGRAGRAPAGDGAAATGARLRFGHSPPRSRRSKRFSRPPYARARLRPAAVVCCVVGGEARSRRAPVGAGLAARGDQGVYRHLLLGLSPARHVSRVTTGHPRAPSSLEGAVSTGL